MPSEKCKACVNCILISIVNFYICFAQCVELWTRTGPFTQSAADLGYGDGLRVNFRRSCVDHRWLIS
jgi:hypothetical protein